MEIIEGIKVEIDRKEVLRLQGYKRDFVPAGEIAGILDSEVEEGYSLITPKAVYKEVGVVGIDKCLVNLDNELVLNMGSLIEDWQSASSVGVVICTIGSALEERVGDLFSQGNYPAALMLDCVGSVALGSVVDSINYLVCERANRQSMKVGARCSPGIGKWELSQQRLLFRILDGNTIGVSLNEQYMMLPKKSRSFCLGIGKGIANGVRMNRCRRCGMKDCSYRDDAGSTETTV